MDMKDLLTKTACTLAESNRLMTLDKISHETGVDREQLRIALDTLSSRNLISKRILEEFDEECYQANDNTKAFCDKFSASVEPQATADQEKPKPKPKAKKSKVTSPVSETSDSTDPVMNFLAEHEAPKSVVQQYEKLCADKERYKHTAGIWEKHIKEMVNNVTKDLTS